MVTSALGHTTTTHARGADGQMWQQQLTSQRRRQQQLRQSIKNIGYSDHSVGTGDDSYFYISFVVIW